MHPKPIRIAVTARRQRGVVLFIALIVLVAMTLAGIGMIRSVDTANIVAGNLGFKQASINAGDNGIEQGFQWLLKFAGSVTLINDSPTDGYYSSSKSPDWDLLGAGTAAAGIVVLPADAAGNIVSYQISRMCNLPSLPFDATGQSCATIESGSGVAGQSMRAPPIKYTAPPNLYYRITAGIKGPRNTVTYVQAMAMITN